MNRHPSNLLTGIVVLAVAAATLAPSVAQAKLRVWAVSASTAIVWGGTYQFPCMGSPLPMPVRFIGNPTPTYFFNAFNPCSAPDNTGIVVATASYVGTTTGCNILMLPVASASFKANMPGTYATTPDSIQDDLRVSKAVTGANQITITITGFARHINAEQGATIDRSLSRLRVAVYPDTASATAQTSLITSGEMTFYGNSTKQLSSGIFSSGDFTLSTVGDGNDFQLTYTGAPKVVNGITNPAAAVVTAELGPTFLGSRSVPASNPWLLSLLSVLLLGGASWLLVKRSTYSA